MTSFDKGTLGSGIAKLADYNDGKRQLSRPLETTPALTGFERASKFARRAGTLAVIGAIAVFSAHESTRSGSPDATQGPVSALYDRQAHDAVDAVAQSQLAQGDNNHPIPVSRLQPNSQP